jgi:hypothetical protein
MGKWSVLFVGMVCIAAGPAGAHDDAYLDTLKAPHGGQLRMAGPNHYELVIAKQGSAARENPVVVYVTDHAQNKIAVKGASGSAIIETGKLKATATLQPDGDNRMKGFVKYAAAPGMTVTVTITLPGGAAETARFTPMGKTAK